MRMMMIVCALSAVGARHARAQDADSMQPAARNVCTSGKVDYWRSQSEAKQQPVRSQDAPNVWVEPIRMPDGRYAPYVPAPEVLQFLENPSVETGERYLAWQRARASKLRRAMEILQALAPTEPAGQAEEKRPGPGNPMPPAPPKEKPGAEPQIELLYFKQASCSYCDAQDRVMQELRTRHPGIALREVANGDRADLWKKHEVTVTPTLVVTAGEEVRAVFRGLTPARNIERAIRKVTTREK